MEQRRQDADATSHGWQFTKQWRPEFAHNRPYTKRSFLEALKRVRSKLDFLTAFLRSEPSTVPSFQSEAVKDFFRQNQHADKTGLPLRRAWIDSRIEVLGESSCKSALMTAPEFAKVLEQQVRMGEITCTAKRLADGSESGSVKHEIPMSIAC